MRVKNVDAILWMGLVEDVMCNGMPVLLLLLALLSGNPVTEEKTKDSRTQHNTRMSSR